MVENVTELVGKKEESIDYVCNNVELRRELSIMHHNVLKSSIVVRDSEVLVAGDKVDIKLSKKGNVYCLVKGKYIGYSKEIISAVFKAKFDSYKVIDELPSFLLISCISKSTNKNYVAWYHKGSGLITKIQTEKAANKDIKAAKIEISYNKMRSEISSNYVPEMVFESDIYESVEDFVSREEELTEMLKVINSMKVRKLLPEEVELLKEIKSELDFII